MKRYILSILAALICVLSFGQKVSKQSFKVRKITYSATDQLVPVDGIFIEINNAMFRSGSDGAFVANIPVTADLGFNISRINAPGYILSIPEDLNARLYLSSNPIVIVVADINAVKRERDKIEAANKKAITQYETRIKDELARNEDLLRSLESKDSEYDRVMAELEDARRRLQAFEDNQEKWLAQVDSLAANLSLVDMQSLPEDEQNRIRGEKNGEWLDAMISKMLDRIDTELTARMENGIEQFKEMLETIADEYTALYISKASPEYIRYFAHQYGKYVHVQVDQIVSPNGKSGLDMIIHKSLEDVVQDILREHIVRYRDSWIERAGEVIRNEDTFMPKSKAEAEEDFILWAMYPDRERLMGEVRGSYKEITDHTKVTEVFDKAHPEFMEACRKTADRYKLKYADFDDDRILALNDEEWFYLSEDISNDIRGQQFFRESDIFYEFTEMMINLVSDDVINKLKIRNNNLIDSQLEAVINAELEPIHSRLLPIGKEDRFSRTIEWKQDKYLAEYQADYKRLKARYPDYFAFLDSIVMRFMKPIIDKYDSDEAAYVYQSSMDNDVGKLCLRPMLDEMHFLEHIEGMKGSDEMCQDILRTIVNIEKSKIISAHNQRLDDILQREKRIEEESVNKLRMTKLSFDDEHDVIAFLATHKFVSEEFSRCSWFDSGITQWHYEFGEAGSVHGYQAIDSYKILEMSSDHAKIKFVMGNTALIANIKIEGDTATYTESASGVSISFIAVNKTSE